MPRLGLAVSDHFNSDASASKPDRFGRRVRHVSGVEIRETQTDATFINPFFVKLALWLTALAFLGMAVALWRLFSFPH